MQQGKEGRGKTKGSWVTSSVCVCGGDIPAAVAAYLPLLQQEREGEEERLVG
jgi:hypothetical protein